MSPLQTSADDRSLSLNAQGALWMLASVAGATAMTLAVRVLTPDLHTAMLAFLRSALGAAFVLPFLWRATHGGPPLAFSLWPLHILRAVLITVALNCGYYAIWHLPLALATILFFTAPVFATVFAVLFAGERVGWRRWSAIGAGFAGALVILQPGVRALEPAMLSALASAFAFGAVLIVGRRISAVDGSSSVFVSSTLIVVLTTLPPALLVWELPADLVAWGAIAVLVVSSSLRTYADIRAYASGDAGFLAPFTYLRLVTIGLAGYIWFAETPDAATLLGGTIIIGATLAISLRERALRKPPSGGTP